MPKTTFNDSTVKTLTVDKTTWFTDPKVKGLRLCVTKGGTKTWWANKWDSHAKKVRAVKIGQWADKGTHCRWAKDQRWSRIFGPIVKVDRMMREVIRNEDTKEPFTRV